MTPARAHMRGIRIITTTIVVLAAFYSDLSAAQTRKPKPRDPSNHEAFFRCKDQNGQTHYSDSMPPECLGRDTEVLNQNGMTLRVIEAEATRAKRLQLE